MKTETWSRYVSEYRRFISYIYEYQRGRRQNNCGYAKVEIRSGVFRLRMHLQPGAGDGRELQVYGFVRKQGSVYGILLGSVGCKNHAYDFQTTSQAAHIGGSAYTAGELRGIWLRGGNENYITIWDDEPVSVEQFTDREPDTAPEKEMQAGAAKEEAPSAAENGQEETQPEEVPENRAEPDTVTQGQREDAERADHIQEDVERADHVQEDAARRDLAQAGQQVGQDAAVEAGELQTQAVQPAGSRNGNPMENANVRASAVEDADRRASAVRRRTGALAERWQNFLLHYPRIYPFADEEITQCIRIAPKDISFLPKEEWQYGKNTYLRQAYSQYHHLMLGCHADGRFVLAVPGCFHDMQEKHLARMYGFPYYKEAIWQTAENAPAAGQTGDEEMHAAGAAGRNGNWKMYGESAAGQTGNGEMCAAGAGCAEPEGYWYHFLNEMCP